MPVYIVMLGPPGVGKGTQSQVLAQSLGLPHVSSGDLFREHIKEQTELGILAKSYMDKGELVPDDVTIAMIRERISQEDCTKGAILDGFPRTPIQADALKTMLNDLNGSAIDLVPFITAPEEVLVERASGRWTCKEQGHIYHEKFSPPEKPGICDHDGSELQQRPDDQEETVQNRIRVYLEKTAPLVEYYKQMLILREIDGSKTTEEVTQQLMLVCKPYITVEDEPITAPA